MDENPYEAPRGQSAARRTERMRPPVAARDRFVTRLALAVIVLVWLLYLVNILSRVMGW